MSHPPHATVFLGLSPYLHLNILVLKSAETSLYPLDQVQRQVRPEERAHDRPPSLPFLPPLPLSLPFLPAGCMTMATCGGTNCSAPTGAGIAAAPPALASLVARIVAGSVIRNDYDDDDSDHRF